jgi:hypothetical protein
MPEVWSQAKQLIVFILSKHLSLLRAYDLLIIHVLVSHNWPQFDHLIVSQSLIGHNAPCIASQRVRSNKIKAIIMLFFQILL